MMGLATGRYSVLRGVSSTDEYGDDVSDDAVSSSNVLGSVIEHARSVYDPQSGRVTTIRYFTGRFNYGADIQDGDRVKDEKTGDTFVVTSVHRGITTAMKPDVVVDLDIN